MLSIRTLCIYAMSKGSSKERTQAGKGLQNMKYTPSLEDFAHIALIESPGVYRFMGQHFNLHSPRSFK
ncbi:hypothetical protein HETIRDRAFT_422128 [Heterobasidion irregulare TC 32-1]|uniref:Uncharacterized protein n=1 Tax=Heterobasidion irregulare (strain TC 32-1) TaxID=747525 RepID=W4JT71_HETIT|nr:uncharacterized protein HETIRDRAFT_422128 [Heterobasidion irregulare TC 32-1]ETW76738.1 hypothetical protein HETIRDRAFT_422128 [Heterobasidion irregulare TC 32-1]